MDIEIFEKLLLFSKSQRHSGSKPSVHYNLFNRPVIYDKSLDHAVAWLRWTDLSGSCLGHLT